MKKFQLLLIYFGLVCAFVSAAIMLFMYFKYENNKYLWQLSQPLLVLGFLYFLLQISKKQG